MFLTIDTWYTTPANKQFIKYDVYDSKEKIDAIWDYVIELDKEKIIKILKLKGEKIDNEDMFEEDLYEIYFQYHDLQIITEEDNKELFNYINSFC